MSVAGGRVLHGSGLDHEIIVSGADLEPERPIRSDGWAEPLTEAQIEAVRVPMEEGLAEFRQSRPDVVDTMLEGMFDPELLPDTLPALSRAMLDGTGRIWVAAFGPLNQSWDETSRWHVLDADGRPMARLRLPASTRLLSVRGDRLAVATRDEVDVGHVRVFEFGWPPG